MLLLGPGNPFLALPDAAVGMNEIIRGVSVERIAQVGVFERGSRGGGSGFGGGGGAIIGEVNHANALAQKGGRGGRRRGGGFSETDTKEFESSIKASAGVMAIVTAV